MQGYLEATDVDLADDAVCAMTVVFTSRFRLKCDSGSFEEGLVDAAIHSG